MPGDIYIFGYQSILAKGSLTSTIGGDLHDSTWLAARLRNHQRTWTAVRDFTDHGSKRYVRTPDWQPAGRVAFANIEPAPNVHVNGICQRVHIDALADLDFREQGYSRVDVTEAIEPYPGMSLPTGARCHAYVDLAPSAAPACISAHYYRMGEQGAAALSSRVPHFLQDYLASTEAPGNRLDEALAFVYFGRDGRHLWLLNEPDSSLVLLLTCLDTQIGPASCDPALNLAEFDRPITTGMMWLDLRHRQPRQPIPAAPSRMAPDLAQAIVDLPVTPLTKAIESTHWLIRLAVTQRPDVSQAALLALTADEDAWVRRAALLRLTSRQPPPCSEDTQPS
ncbi:gamma-glutamylcyclotransferase family protein [Aquabacterium sp.]|uniref:gamma-glutamylcyclotransferase family protein n=1 Tax=Aquabacterium sp. TaxID=1872578 RepID=UPI0035B22598